jgi:hypothetical protein
MRILFLLSSIQRPASGICSIFPIAKHISGRQKGDPRPAVFDGKPVFHKKEVMKFHNPIKIILIMIFRIRIRIIYFLI